MSARTQVGSKHSHTRTHTENESVCACVCEKNRNLQLFAHCIGSLHSTVHSLLENSHINRVFCIII